MKKEIERKYLFNPGYKYLLKDGILFRQGYLYSDSLKTIRIRVLENSAFLCIKNKTGDISRDEFEYQIPVDDANYLLKNFCLNFIVEKYRTKIKYNDLVWEIDNFIGENEGLLLAEVELESEDQIIALPEWVDKEVTFDSKYYNSSLSRNPYSKWL